MKVLYISQYNSDGRFMKPQWKNFIEWCIKECNSMIIYSSMNYETICSKFPMFCKVIELESPDKEIEIFAYEIEIKSNDYWSYIENYDYGINSSDNISHMYFKSGNMHIAYLEIEDCDNYVMLEDDIINTDCILPTNDLILENIQACMKGKYDIEDLLQDEKWRPLGA